MFAHTYFLEMVQTISSLMVFALAAYIFYHRAEDHYAAKYLHSQGLVPDAILVTTRGNLTVEIWRIAMCLLMVVLAGWATTAPPPPGPGRFWNPEQYTLGRILFIVFIALKGMGALAQFIAQNKSMDAALEFVPNVSALRPEEKPTRLGR